MEFDRMGGTNARKDGELSRIKKSGLFVNGSVGEEDQLSRFRALFVGEALLSRPSVSRHFSSSSSTCLLRDRRSCFAISVSRPLRLAGTRTSRATLGSVMATSKNSRIQQLSACNVMIHCDTL